VNLITSLLGSKKFIAMLCGLIGLLILKVFKVSVDPQTVAEIVGLVASFIVGQGIADNGKDAAKVNAIASLAVPGTSGRAVEEIKKV